MKKSKMKLEEPTTNELTQMGKEILCKELGITNTIKFLQGYTKGHGNYTEERRETFKNLSVDDIVKSIESK